MRIEPETDTQDNNILAPAATAPPVVRLDTSDLTPEPKTAVKLLMEGTFHKNEVWRGAEGKNWLGLFKDDKGYVLRPTTLRVTTVQDPVLDNQGVFSGREVTATEKDALFFITGMKPSAAGSIDTASFTRTTLAAGKQLTYTFKGKEYHIKAQGDSVQASTGEYRYSRYGWVASGTKNGRKVEQLVAEDSSFDDSIYLLLWAGDLDRDGIPDLLLDLSNHYNVSRYVLLLSSHAEKGKLYKKVAVFEAIGC